MKGINRFKLLSIVLLLAYLLSACSGVSPQSGNPVGGGKPQAKEVAFTGTVQAVSGSEITVSGQVVAIDARTVLDPNIKVGDIVRVEAQVTESGAVIALTVESSSVSDDATNSNDGNANDDNANTNTGDDNTNSSDNTNGDDNTNSNDNDAGSAEQEIFGVVEAITADSVTIDGVVYQLSSFTEFDDPVSVGDNVKLHVIVNADGTLTVREIEQSDGSDDDNSNDDNGNDDNSNEDNDNDDDSDDDNSNDDDDDDDNSNSGSNSNGG